MPIGNNNEMKLNRKNFTVQRLKSQFSTRLRRLQEYNDSKLNWVTLFHYPANNYMNDTVPNENS